MKFQKTINSFDTTSDNKDLLKNRSKFMINKKKNYSVNKEIKIKTPILKSDLFVLRIKHDILYKNEIPKNYKFARHSFWW